ncbi:hypothetical protein BJG92_03556 [Arthrobacter sp. SO5]|uniref:hypothetical protein n=1 Tax=Arthrobacter sp. SO5 TaxID=1897055 RepID=UPI001E4BD186|nr:hypothetical protein [Arthrobacter sp. SO5]MCB5276001.1 hypothetical protein [Arthrobacter sp. SO5]
MESKASPAIPARQPVARVMKAGIVVGWIIMATGVLAMVVASRFSPAALAAITAAIACMAGVFVVLYQATGQWTRDPGY